MYVCIDIESYTFYTLDIYGVYQLYLSKARGEKMMRCDESVHSCLIVDLRRQSIQVLLFSSPPPRFYLFI